MCKNLIKSLWSFLIVLLLFWILVELAYAVIENIPANRHEININFNLSKEEIEAEENVKELDYFISILDKVDKIASKMAPADKWELTRAIVDYSKVYNLDPSFILSIIKIESGFNRYAVSPSNARGLMQLVPLTAKAVAYELEEKWDEKKLFEIRTNVRYGLYYFKKLEMKYGRKDYALAAYNFGPTYVDRIIREGDRIPSDYASKVLTWFNKLNQEDT